MIADTLTVMWREFIYLLRGSRSPAVILRYLAFILIFGVIVPWQSGIAWLRTPLPVIYWSWLAIYLASAATSGSFAREREMHTLETLLASRLPDRTILLGKIMAGVVYGGALALITLAAGQVILLFKTVGGVAVYSFTTAVGGYLVSLLAAFAIGALASFISLKAQTTRQAQAALSMFILLFFLPLAVLEFLPNFQNQVLSLSMGANNGLVISLVLASLFVADIVLWAMARARFKRNRLIRIV